MDKEEYLIAVASSDGIIINNHFGRTRFFFIYRVRDDINIQLVEKREIKPVCEAGNHDEGQLRKALLRLSDCKYLLVSRIGQVASIQAEKMGITAMELPGEIIDSIEQLIKFRKIQNLLERK